MKELKKEKDMFEQLYQIAEDIENGLSNPLAVRMDNKNPSNWSFTIKYKITKPNVAIQEEFVNFAKQFADDNYLQAVSLLLRGWKQDVAVAMLFDEVMRNRELIGELRDELEQNKERQEDKPKAKTFGGEGK